MVSRRKKETDDMVTEKCIGITFPHSLETTSKVRGAGLRLKL